jgi:phosphonate transport system permease protein
MAASDTTEAAVRRKTLPELMLEADRQVRLERGRNLAIAAVFLVVLAFTYRRTEFDPLRLLEGLVNMQRVIAGFAHPDLKVLPDVVRFAFETLFIAILGTTIGTLIAIPLSFIAARNLMRRSIIGSAVYFVVRALMSVIRSVPTLFWGILWVITVGIGPFPGVLAVATFSVGLISKLFSEAIEAIDWGQVEALTATGANPLQVIVHGVLPQVTPYMIANVLYSFEVNVHSSTVLGVVGAGGIGLLFQQYIGLFLYSDMATLLIVVIVMTMVIDYSSAAIRRRII